MSVLDRWKQATEQGAVPMKQGQLSGGGPRKVDGQKPSSKPDQPAHTLTEPEVLKLLATKGAVLANHFDTDDVPFLWHMASTGYSSVVDEILKHREEWKVEIDEPAKKERSSPLYVAAQNGHLKACELLLKAGADVNKPRDTGATPLLIATQFKHLECVKLLLHYNANCDLENNQKSTPFVLAASMGHTDIALLLLQHGSKMDHSGTGLTAVQWAAKQNHVETKLALMGIMTEQMFLRFTFQMWQRYPQVQEEEREIKRKEALAALEVEKKRKMEELAALSAPLPSLYDLCRNDMTLYPFDVLKLDDEFVAPKGYHLRPDPSEWEAVSANEEQFTSPSARLPQAEAPTPHSRKSHKTNKFVSPQHSVLSVTASPSTFTKSPALKRFDHSCALLSYLPAGERLPLQERYIGSAMKLVNFSKDNKPEHGSVLSPSFLPSSDGLQQSGLDGAVESNNDGPPVFDGQPDTLRYAQQQKQLPFSRHGVRHLPDNFIALERQQDASRLQKLDKKLKIRKNLY